MDERVLTFLVDRMLGKLARYLRMLGFDTLYFTQTDVSALLETGYKEKRIILSRNTILKKKGDLSDFLFITDDHPDKQLSEVLTHFKVQLSSEQLFTRCLTCNQKLIIADPEEVKGKVPSYIFETHQKFLLCPECEKVFWAGTHVNKMKEIIRKAGEGSFGNGGGEA